MGRGEGRSAASTAPHVVSKSYRLGAMGIEPMKPKVMDPQERRLPIYQTDLSEIYERFEAIFLIDAFSHIRTSTPFPPRLRHADGRRRVVRRNRHRWRSRLDARLPRPPLHAGSPVVCRGGALRAYLDKSNFSIVATKAFRVDIDMRFARPRSDSRSNCRRRSPPGSCPPRVTVSRRTATRLQALRCRRPARGQRRASAQ
jgi:hypothetical protein